ncbi:MAG: FadR family transcriptional regulator [SAR324 cluster bacterium]|jgi:GntR family transcriptional repressor for pyruvate dehydrogenase complex|nr:FadR family transcriptional regulator [SAR324 cluster bacterium]MCH2265891.1 FadR family transcriptional regulator [SAR324 cluster bacterium]
MLLKAVRSQRRFEQVAEQISKLIKKGKLKPGMRLPPERELAKQLEVSRPTVREAMIALEISGLVEVRVGSGIYVLDFSKQKKKLSNKIAEIGHGPLELIEARKEIEGANAALAAQRIEPDSLKKMEKAIEKMVKENMNGADGDREFHLLLAKSTGNRVLETITAYLWEQQQHSPMWIKLIELMEEKKLHNVILDDHRTLLDALRRKDSEEAEAIMRNHLNHARDIYFDIIDEKGT